MRPMSRTAIMTPTTAPTVTLVLWSGVGADCRLRIDPNRARRLILGTGPDAAGATAAEGCRGSGIYIQCGVSVVGW